MNVVESRKVRDILNSKIKALRTANNDVAADIVQSGLIEIMQDEKFITIEQNENIFVDRIRGRLE